MQRLFTQGRKEAEAPATPEGVTATSAMSGDAGSPASATEEVSSEGNGSTRPDEGALEGGKSVMDHRKHKLFTEEFGLPEDEVYLDDFACALKARFLQQGRLYVFSKHACFHSSLFGNTKIIVFEFAKIVGIDKAKNVGLPNTIKIQYNGKQRAFTSFIKRDAAYDILARAWSTNSELGRKYLLGSMSKRDLMRAAESSGLDRKDGDDSGDDGDYDDEADAHGIDWEPLAEPLPAMDAAVVKDAQVVVEKNFRCSAMRFFNVLLSDESNFQQSFSADVLKDWDIAITDWKQVKEGVPKYVRDFSFMKALKVKAPGAPSKTMCQQSQQLQLFKDGEDDVVLLECSQIMPDIPFGDSFSVQQRWEITESSGGNTSLKIWVWIPFTKSTMFKGMIQKTTFAETREVMAKWAANADKRLKAGRRKGGAADEDEEEDESLSPAVRALLKSIPKEHQATVRQMLVLAGASSGSNDAVNTAGGLGAIFVNVVEGFVKILNRIVSTLLMRSGDECVVISRRTLVVIASSLMQALFLFHTLTVLWVFHSNNVVRIPGFSAAGSLLGVPHAETPALSGQPPADACEGIVEQLQAMQEQIAKLGKK
ncbi:unnamed protein product [Pedinophyceae sp. YPF-701]|nr:unnamed protein product [Pedinophyceae sp. YPF-701]